MPKVAITQIELALARSLFRSDKWDPARDQQTSFVWEAYRSVYTQRAKRLMRTFEKDGLVLEEKLEMAAAE